MFDFVIAIEIIEHIENPFHFMRQAKAMLQDAEDGAVLITTPNPLSVKDRLKFLFLGRIDMLEHEDHRTPIFPQTIDKICEETGLKVQTHTFDIDHNEVYSTWRGFLRKIGINIIENVLGNKGYLKGISNIWVLVKG